MHGLDVLMRLNAEHAGREAAHELKDGNTLGEHDCERAAIQQQIDHDHQRGLNTLKHYFNGFKKGVQE